MTKKVQPELTVSWQMSSRLWSRCSTSRSDRCRVVGLTKATDMLIALESKRCARSLMPRTTDLKQGPSLSAQRPTRVLAGAELRALVSLAIPLVVTQLAQMALMTTDLVLLGRFSAHALASAAIGNTVYYFVWLLGSGPAFAVSPLVARVLGAGVNDRVGVRSLARMGLWSAPLASMLLAPVLLSAGPILQTLGQQPHLARSAGQFDAALCLGLPFAIGFQVLRNLIAALGRPKVVLCMTLASIVWNAAAGYGLIFGHFGAAPLGLVGGGLATSSSAIFGFLALLTALHFDRQLRAYRILRRVHRAHWPRLRELVRLGAPIGVTILFEAMLFNVMTLVIGRFGEAAVAAHQVALNFASITFMVPFGVGLAATVRVGRAAGAGSLRDARQAGLIAMAVAAGCVSLSAVAMALFGREIASLYDPGRSERDLYVVALATRLLKVAAVFQLFDALQVVGSLSLRGLKDARWPMILAGFSYWIAGAPMCLLLGVGLNWQGVGVWVGLAFGLTVAATLMCGRFLLLTERATQL